MLPFVSQTSTPELDSALYGSLAHVTEVLIDHVSADAGISRVLGAPPIPGCIYIGSRGLARNPATRKQLKRWATEPQSPFTHTPEQTYQPAVKLINASHPQSQWACTQITRVLGSPRTVSGMMQLNLGLENNIQCMTLLIRRHENRPFHEADSKRIGELAQRATQIIRQGLTRQLAGESKNEPGTSLAPISTDILLQRLSKTERGVLQLLLQRETEKSIAKTINRSPHTVHVHVKSIYRKLMVSSRKQLLQMLDGRAITPVDLDSDEDKIAA